MTEADRTHMVLLFCDYDIVQMAMNDPLHTSRQADRPTNALR